jgi:hypothetical protein
LSILGSSIDLDPDIIEGLKCIIKKWTEIYLLQNTDQYWAVLKLIGMLHVAVSSLMRLLALLKKYFAVRSPLSVTAE